MARLTSLPLGLLARLLRLLALPDRRRAVLTCRHLARAGAHPLLWAEVAIPRPLPPGGLATLLGIPRLTLLHTLHLPGLKLALSTSLAAQMFRYIDANTNLRSLDLSSTNLSGLPAFPLACSLSKVPELLLSATQLTTEQLTSLLGRLTTPQPRRTTHLDLSFNDKVRFVQVALLSRAVKVLVRVNLSYTELDNYTTPDIMESMANSQLEELDMSGCQLAKTAMDNLGLNQCLSTITLAEVTFDPEKLDMVLTNLSLVRNLSRLDLSRSVLTDSDPILLADCVKRVPEVFVPFCWLYMEHIEFILDAVTEETSVTTVLDLSGNHLEDVDRELLVEAADHLGSFKLEWCNLQEQQVEAVVGEERKGQVVLSGREMLARFPGFYREMVRCKSITLAMDAEHEAPTTQLLMEGSD